MAIKVRAPAAAAPKTQKRARVFAKGRALAPLLLLLLLLLLLGGSLVVHCEKDTQRSAFYNAKGEKLFGQHHRQRREGACPPHVTKGNAGDVRSCIYSSVASALNVTDDPPLFGQPPWRLMPHYYFAPTQQDDTIQLNVLSGLFLLQITQGYSQLKVGAEQVFWGSSLSNDVALSIVITSNPLLLGSASSVPTNSFFQTEVVAIQPVCAPGINYTERPLWNSETSSHVIMDLTVAASYHTYQHPCACANASEDQCLHLLQPLKHTLGTVSGSGVPSGSRLVNSTALPAPTWPPGILLNATSTPSTSSTEDAVDEAQDSVDQCASEWTDTFITLGLVSAGVYVGLVAGELFANHKLLPWKTRGDKVYSVGLGFFDVTSFTFSLVQSQAPGFPLACATSAASVIISAAVLQGTSYGIIGIQMLAYLPLFLCITSRQRLLGFAFGFSYCLASLVFSSRWLDCLTKEDPLNVMVGLPHVLGLALLASWFAVQLVLRLRLWVRYLLQRGPAPASPGQEALQRLDRRAYVRMLLAGNKPSPQDEKNVPLLHVLPQVLMGHAHYRLSSRLIAVVAMANAIIFSFIPRAIMVFKDLGQLVEGLMSGFHCCNGQPCTDLPNYNRWLFDPLQVGAGWQVGDGERCPSVQLIVREALYIGLTVCVVLAMLVLVGITLRTLVVYRRRMLRLFAGNASFLPKKRPTTRKTISSTVKFAGTAVALSVGAWLAMSFVLCLTLMIIIFTTVLPIADVYDDWFWHRLFDSLIFNRDTNQLGILCTLIINYIVLYAVVKGIFLISSKQPGIKRPGFFGIVDMFEFYVYCFNGIIVLLTRMGMGLLFQVLFVGRLDCITFPRGCEKYDTAFRSYMAFMLMDEYYTHPVFLSANWVLLRAARSCRTASKAINSERMGSPHAGGGRQHGSCAPSMALVGPSASGQGTLNTAAPLKERVRRLLLGNRGPPPPCSGSDSDASSADGGEVGVLPSEHAAKPIQASVKGLLAASAPEHLEVHPSRPDATMTGLPLLHDTTVPGDEKPLEAASQPHSVARDKPVHFRRRYRNKWMLLVTLTNNPALAELRAHVLEQQKEGDGDKGSNEDEEDEEDDDREDAACDDGVQAVTSEDTEGGNDHEEGLGWKEFKHDALEYNMKVCIV